MKKVLKFLGCLCALMLAIMLTSCDKLRGYDVKDAPPEQTAEEYIAEVVNPTLLTVDEVISYQARLLEQSRIEETFLSIPSATLRNIATVCIKQDGNVTKSDIVYEYLANQSVYDNLPGSPAQESIQLPPDVPPIPPVQITVEDLAPSSGNVPPPSTTTRVENDTMNGTPLRVTIKEERTYEKQ